MLVRMVEAKTSRVGTVRARRRGAADALTAASFITACLAALSMLIAVALAAPSSARAAPIQFGATVDPGPGGRDAGVTSPERAPPDRTRTDRLRTDAAEALDPAAASPPAPAARTDLPAPPTAAPTVAPTTSVEASVTARFDGGLIPDPAVTLPEGPASGLVVLFSDGPRGAAEAEAAARLSAAGAAVIAVDSLALIAALNASDRDCAYLVSDIERLGREVARATSGEEFHAPILAGAGLGGALALDILTQTPPATLDAVLVADPDGGAPLTAPLCTRAARIEGAQGAAYILPPGPPRAELSIALTADAPDHARARVAAMEAEGVRFERIAPVPGASAARALSDALAFATSRRALEGDARARVELPARPTRGTMAIVISGDGGWRDIDRKLAQALQADGVPVIGLDALRWFWTERSAAETARELARLIDLYAARWGTPHVALIGYSFGAGVLPEAFLALPSAHRDRVALISLLGLAGTADWEITVSGWLGSSSDAARAVAPALARLPLERVQCVHGKKEDDSICPTLRGGPADVVTTEGGHHFGGDYEALARHVLTALDRRLATRGAPAPRAEAEKTGPPGAAASAPTGGG